MPQRRGSLPFAYRNHAGEPSQSEVQPLRLAHYGRRWYLIAWDTARAIWRSFRVDPIDGAPRVGASFEPRPVPTDVAARLERGIANAPFSCRITLRLQGSVEELQAVLPVYCGVLEPESDTHNLLRVGAESPEGVLAQVLMVGRELELVEGAEQPPQLLSVLERIRCAFPAVEAAVPPGRPFRARTSQAGRWKV